MTEMHKKSWKIPVILLVIIIAGGGYILQLTQNPELPEGFASGNGRLEAIEVDITTKIGGRLKNVTVKEGDKVEVNQVLARIDTKELSAQLRRAEAEVRSAQQQRFYALAVIEQRKSELMLARKDLTRSKGLYENDSISLEQLQRIETLVQTANATLAASRAQLSNADAAIEAAIANTEFLKAQLDESVLKSPISGRVLYRLVEPGEVLANGGKVLTVLDPLDVYMTIFLPIQQATKIRVGTDARIIIDSLENLVIPANVSFVAPRAQFTPKEVETRTEREKLTFRIKIKLDTELLKTHEELGKTGIPGVAYLRLDANAEWPEHLQQASQ